MRTPIHRYLTYSLIGLVTISLLAIGLFARILSAQQSSTASPLPTPTSLVPLITASPTEQSAKVVYIQQGDLWVKTLPDGEPQRLTQNGNNYAPRWSPSGELLSSLMDPAYPNVRVLQRDGTGVTIFGGPVYDAYAWSPLRDWLAYGIDGQIGVSGMPLVRYADIPAPVGTSRQIAKLAWHPDGQQLAFTWQARQEGSGNVVDGLWVVAVPDGRPQRLLDGTVPETGEFILHGWSGDGEYLLYWQAPLLSASILADGVSLYAFPVAGGMPQVIVDAVLVQDDAVQVRPGSDQIAVVVGAGRAVWTNKRLHLLSTTATEQRLLSLEGQSAAAPAWSPNGQRLAYVGMPDTPDAVVGGDRAHDALQQRRIWLLDEGLTAPIQLTGLTEDAGAMYRDEAPQWVDEDTLLFARLDVEGHLSLWTVDTDGTALQPVLEEISPAPEWFGEYGYIDWRNIFAVWQPAMAAGMEAERQAQEALPAAFPPLQYEGRSHSLASFLERLHTELTPEEAQTIWGDPEMSSGTWNVATGEQLVTLQYALDDDLRIRLGFANDGPLAFVQLQNRNGYVFALMPFEALHTLAEEAAAPRPPALFGTATPLPTPLQSPLATPMSTRTP